LVSFEYWRYDLSFVLHFNTIHYFPTFAWKIFLKSFYHQFSSLASAFPMEFLAYTFKRAHWSDFKQFRKLTITKWLGVYQLMLIYGKRAARMFYLSASILFFNPNINFVYLFLLFLAFLHFLYFPYFSK